MGLLSVLFGILILLVLIIKKLNPMLALLIASIVTGLLLGMPAAKVMISITNGIGSTLGSMVMVLALGAMIGKLAEDSGAAKKIVYVLIRIFGFKNIQWAVLLTGILVGIPLFYNAGFVVLIPLVFTIASAAKLPKLYVGIPMAAALSVTHGFLPPHPGPVALAGIFHADLGKVLIYGFTLSVPIAILAGIVLPRIIIKLPQKNGIELSAFNFDGEQALPSAFKSFVIALSPIFLIAAGTVGSLLFASGPLHTLFIVLSDPTLALLTSLLITLLIQKLSIQQAMESCVEGVKGIAMILMIIAAGGAFKQILVDSAIGEQVKALAASIHANPLFLGWLIAAVLRVTLGSATVAALTASGMVIPFIAGGASPELMVLAIGSGSLMFSHVNDTGFWMFKEYFNLSLKETFKTWTLMETIVSLLGLAGVMLLSAVV
ncbi:GntT/GntP/DsdX family permease [Pedobacter duraquae]|uniref:Gluconate permease GntT n=1 Tax=Pedobacter duraquae TaxID=425511 RepID=A0A4R6IL48_9SPHI|nr:gluconate:H+ symporter [Pedobacter duraquae]TDO22812.1 gluconate permease GntT [Pedobacter duraquae]